MDVKLTFTNPTAGAVNQFIIHWALNGSPIGNAIIVQQSDVGDNSGYSTTLLAAVPGAAIKNRDIITATVIAQCLQPQQSSAPANAGPLTIIVPPGPPVITSFVQM